MNRPLVERGTIFSPNREPVHRLSRCQHLCKFIGTKESVCIRKEFPQDPFGTPTWPSFHCFGTPILAAVTSCENTLYNVEIREKFWMQASIAVCGGGGGSGGEGEGVRHV